MTGRHSNLTKLNWHDLFPVCLNMRESDAREVYGLLPHNNPYRLSFEAATHINSKGRGVIAWHLGQPVAMAAFVEDCPGVWQVYMFGTDKFDRVVVDLMRWVREEARDILSHVAGHRLSCESRADHTEAHKLIRALGGREEATLRRRGKDGADYKIFVWLAGEHEEPLKKHMTRVA